MTDLTMPKARDFGWALKPRASTHFAIHQRPNGQFSVVLNHALLRGVTAEMIHWWFLHFPSLRVRLDDVPGYEGQTVPAYLLWHPSDHLSATLSGTLGPGGTAQPGAKITIREAMQYDRYGWQYKVDNSLSVVYVAGDGWAMGLTVPLLGPTMMLRISFKDVVEEGRHLGVHYHYEIVAGLSGDNPLARFLNSRITAHFSPAFFEAWHTHNAIEVGVFENFLPALYSQRRTPESLRYARELAPSHRSSPDPQEGHDAALFDRRVAAYRDTDDPYAVLAYRAPSFL